MARGKAEDAGGLTPAKDDNAALCHFGRRTLPIFKCVDYMIRHKGKAAKAQAVWSILREGVRPNANDNDCHIPHSWFYSDDSSQGQGKRKPPPGPVTVS